MANPRYLWRPPRTKVVDECFAAVGRALYLAQRYEEEVGEAALRARFEAVMSAARQNTADELARRLWSRTLHQKIEDLADAGGYVQLRLIEAKHARNYLAHQAALEIATLTRASSPSAMLLQRRRFLAKLEYNVLLLWLAYDDVAWINEAIGAYTAPETPSLEEEFLAVKEWVSTDFAKLVRNRDRQYVTRAGESPSSHRGA